MNIQDITIGQIVVSITSLGVVFGFAYKIFSVFSKVNENTKQIADVLGRIDALQHRYEEQRNEILHKVDETNRAVNLLCNAISAMIEHDLSTDKDDDELKLIKTKLDEKKGIV